MKRQQEPGAEPAVFAYTSGEQVDRTVETVVF